MKKLIIIGAGGQAEVAHEQFSRASAYIVAAFSVEAAFVQDESFLDLPLAPLETLERCFSPSEYAFHVAMGMYDVNRLRTRLYRDLRSRGYEAASFISPAASVAPSAFLGDHCWINDRAVVLTRARLTENNLVSQGAIVGHHCVVGENAFIGPGATLCGHARIGANAVVGAGATVLNGVIMHEFSIAGAGAVISRDLPAECMAKPAPVSVHANAMARFSAWCKRTSARSHARSRDMPSDS